MYIALWFILGIKEEIAQELKNYHNGYFVLFKSEYWNMEGEQILFPWEKIIDVDRTSKSGRGKGFPFLRILKYGRRKNLLPWIEIIDVYRTPKSGRGKDSPSFEYWNMEGEKISFPWT